MPRVLILHTGGTLGMTGEPLKPDAFSMALTDAVPEIAGLAELEIRIVFNLDSSDMGPPHWTELAQIIDANRRDFDGFVIVHGTDTMAYTASALAYGLCGLDRPVILTGAQRPLAALRTDARRNLVDAVELATRPIFEVGICFDGLLLHGARTTKSNAHDYRAFESPNAAPLARLGVDVEMEGGAEHRKSPYLFRPDFDPSVLVLQVSPGMNPAHFRSLASPESGLRGLVLAAYGLGTVPTGDPDVAAVVADAVDAGIDVLTVTQSAGRIDLSQYENSRALRDAGAISGGEMTVEAAVTKLMHGLANFTDRDSRRAYLLSNVAGERGAHSATKN